jgi:hypothetical protein
MTDMEKIILARLGLHHVAADVVDTEDAEVIGRVVARKGTPQPMGFANGPKGLVGVRWSLFATASKSATASLVRVTGSVTTTPDIAAILNSRVALPPWGKAVDVDQVFEIGGSA